MAYEYVTDEARDDKWTLPDVEVFYAALGELQQPDEYEQEEPSEPGFYWWACLPGCMPDSDPFGPFATYDEALQDARDTYDDDGH